LLYWKRLRAPGWPYFLALSHAGIARQAAGGLQNGPESGVHAQQGPGDAQANGPRLAGQAAAADVDMHIVFGGGFSQGQGLGGGGAVGFHAEIIFKSASVDENFSRSGGEANSGDGGFAASGAAEFFDLCHDEKRELRLRLGLRFCD
jgi:hypothetical protein